MSQEMDDLETLAGRAVAAQFGPAPGFVGRIEPGASLALTGEDSADLNMLILGQTPRAQAVLEEATTLASGRRLPMVAFVAPQVAAPLREAASWLGLAVAGSAPLMVFEPAGPVPAGKPCEVASVDDAAAAAVSGDLIASAFGLPREAVARTIDAASLEGAGVRSFVARIDGEPMSSVTLTPRGRTAGIWCMATPADRQGRGAGRALLTRVLEDARQAGVRRFYLFASAAGRPLYESIGFRVVADYALWTLGEH
jgi:predicted N-acetyltransferase YhbS